MIRSAAVCLTLALLLPLALATDADAGKKGGTPKKASDGLDVKGRITLTIHKVTMTQGVPHLIEVQAKGFVPYVKIVGEYVRSSPRLGFKPSHDFKGIFTPMQSKEYTILVMPDLLAEPPAGPSLDYTLKVKPVHVADKPLLKVADKVTDKDMKLTLDSRNSFYKSYPIKLKAGQTYVIDLEHAKGDFKLDPYLYLKDGNEVADRDDDSGGDLNARIVYTAPKDGEFTIIATTLRAGMTGPFTLTVRGPAEGKAK